MSFFTIWKNLREPQVGMKSRKVRDGSIGLIIRQEFVIPSAKKRGVQGDARWFAQTYEIFLFASSVGQVEYLPASGPGAD